MAEMTAVEILIEKIKLKDKDIYWELSDELEQAKEMQKQQIIDAHLLNHKFRVQKPAAMTPKEKAEELINRFTEHTKVFHENLGWVDYHDSAKECALISVTEIMYELKKNHAVWDNKYWIEVKAEIEKL